MSTSSISLLLASYRIASLFRYTHYFLKCLAHRYVNTVFQKACAFCAQGQEKVPWAKNIAPWEESLAPLAQAVDKDPTIRQFWIICACSTTHTSKSQWNCLTASAVPWNHFLPASPGVWVAARTYHKKRSKQLSPCLFLFPNHFPRNFSGATLKDKHLVPFS